MSLRIYSQAIIMRSMIAVNFRPGDIVRVHQKLQENEKSRTQVFEGTVLAIKGTGDNRSFLVRKVIDNVAVERIWPFASPLLEKVEIKEKAKKAPKRAKLYYLRHKLA